MTAVDHIAARLSSIAPTRLATFPLSVQRLLQEDMPRLIELARAVEVQLKQRDDVVLSILVERLRKRELHVVGKEC